MTHKEQDEERAIRYAKWLARRDGIDLDQANDIHCRWQIEHLPTKAADHLVRIEAVEFNRVTSAYDWNAAERVEVLREPIATIEIPH